jgi:hypothetical protein
MEALHFVIQFLVVPAITFLAGLFLPHVQKPLTEYRKTLADISQLMLQNVPILYGDSRRTAFSHFPTSLVGLGQCGRYACAVVILSAFAFQRQPATDSLDATVLPSR